MEEQKTKKMFLIINSDFMKNDYDKIVQSIVVDSPQENLIQVLFAVDHLCDYDKKDKHSLVQSYNTVEETPDKIKDLVNK